MVCARCLKPFDRGEFTVASALKNTLERMVLLCIECSDDEEHEINKAGTTDIPRLVDAYVSNIEQSWFNNS
jgi:hypothetical protein